MKKLIGAAILLLCLALTALVVLRIWGVSVVSSHALLRSGLTLGILTAATVILIIIWFFFFPNPAAGYDQSAGHRAHPKR